MEMIRATTTCKLWHYWPDGLNPTQPQRGIAGAAEDHCAAHEGAGQPGGHAAWCCAGCTVGAPHGGLDWLTKLWPLFFLWIADIVLLVLVVVCGGGSWGRGGRGGF